MAGAEPSRDIGAHCDDPFHCPFKGYCGRDLPAGPQWPTTLLPDAAGKKIARQSAGQGIDDLLQLGAETMPTDKLRRIHQATLTGIAWHDAAAILAETRDWAYPRTFLDFETVQFAIPRWIGTRPYEQVPFQFSAHIEAADGQTRHRSFLSIDGLDHRRACTEALAELPASGAVIAWNASFERGCLLGLASMFPDLALALRDIADRLVDLLPVVRRHYYHREMRGSWSIKAVLPTLAPELAYDGLDGVKSGTDAQAAFLEAIAVGTSDQRREELRAALLGYCKRDTLAMKVVLQRLLPAAP